MNYDTLRLQNEDEQYFKGVANRMKAFVPVKNMKMPYWWRIRVNENAARAQALAELSYYSM